MLLERALASATSWVRKRVYVDRFDDDETQEAIVLLASRLYKRRQSPEGVSGWNEMGVVRVLASDPDIVRLLEHQIDTTKAGIA